MVGLQILTLPIGVRVPVPQPFVSILPPKEFRQVVLAALSNPIFS
jgi:hypothetical protein